MILLDLAALYHFWFFFVTLPKIPGTSGRRPTSATRMVVLEVARKEFESIIAKDCVPTDLRSKWSKSALYGFSVDAPVMLHRDKEKKLVGPHKFCWIQNKVALVNIFMVFI